MSFDPEKVTLFDFNHHEELVPSPDGGWVFSADYSKLLELYRAAKKDVRPLCSHGCIDGQCAICK